MINGSLKETPVSSAGVDRRKSLSREKLSRTRSLPTDREERIVTVNRIPICKDASSSYLGGKQRVRFETSDPFERSLPLRASRSQPRIFALIVTKFRTIWLIG